MTVGQRIKAYLEDNGINQTWLSISSKIPLPKLNLTLNGHRRMTFDEYEIICGVLKVGVDKFIQPRLPERKGTNSENV